MLCAKNGYRPISDTRTRAVKQFTVGRKRWVRVVDGQSFAPGGPVQRLAQPANSQVNQSGSQASCQREVEQVQ